MPQHHRRAPAVHEIQQQLGGGFGLFLLNPMTCTFHQRDGRPIVSVSYGSIPVPM